MSKNKNQNNNNNDFQDSRKASEYRNRAKNTSEEAEKILDNINQVYENIKILKENILKEKETVEKNNIEITTIKDDYEKNVNKLKDLVDSLETIFSDYPDLDNQISSFESQFENLSQLNTKINTLHTNSLSRKKEIDQFYYEIIWYTTLNEKTWEDELVEWLKSKLEKIYSDLENNLKNTKKEIETYKQEKEKDFSEMKINAEESYEKLKNNWEWKFIEIENKIQSLLPNALTAGLSSAYSKKKNNEEKELSRVTNNFYWGIWLLIFVSLIPFIVSIIFLFQDKTLEDVILKLPRLVLSILPLYFPVWWFAYYANKRINLSKRLIEEYTHKEVLSLTFEWLSTQISNLDDSDISKELKIKLLTNILDVSSENPWKLISDYNSSDHPIIDALNKSEKLSKSIQRLEKIPWLTKVADLLKNTTKKVIDKKEEAIAQAIDEVTK